MTFCSYCLRLGKCGPQRRCTSPRHPDNITRTRREARARRRTAMAQDIAARHFPFDGSDPATVIECRRRTTAAILEALDRA